ncbi:MAG TPA: hypothetical protein VGF59_11745 [Bryobacteraceae bacterium]|jgi:hypothetical protein
MTFMIIPSQTASHGSKKTKVTCLTCKLKGCVGRCRFQAVDCPRPPKAA